MLDTISILISYQIKLITTGTVMGVSYFGIILGYLDGFKDQILHFPPHPIPQVGTINDSRVALNKKTKYKI